MFLRSKPEGSHGSAPNPGALVVTRDGEELGKVAEVEGSYFKVDAPMRRDYWLGSDFIVQSSRESVSLSFAKGELDAHTLAEPGLEAAEDPMRDIALDAVILSDGELLEQRARMERELAEQRSALPIHQSGGEDGTVGEPVEVELERLEDELGDAASALSSSTGAVVPRQSMTPEDPDQARMRAAASVAATGQPSGGASGTREFTSAAMMPETAASNGSRPSEVERNEPTEDLWDPWPHATSDHQGASAPRRAAIAVGIAGIALAIVMMRRRRSRSASVAARLRALPDKLAEVA